MSRYDPPGRSLSPLESEDSYPFCVNLRSKTSGLVYSLWVGPMNVGPKRAEIVTKLRDECPRVGFKRSKAYQVEGDWNRLSAVERIMEWDEDDEPAPAAIAETVKRFLGILYPRLEQLALTFKPLCDRPSSESRTN